MQISAIRGNTLLLRATGTLQGFFIFSCSANTHAVIVGKKIEVIDGIRALLLTL
jgi:hypothetical protein